MKLKSWSCPKCGLFNNEEDEECIYCDPKNAISAKKLIITTIIVLIVIIGLLSIDVYIVYKSTT